MKLENLTDIPDSNGRKIIAFVRPKNLPTSNIDVRMTNCSRNRLIGMCYPDGYHDVNKPLIILRITKNESKFPSRSDHSPKKLIKLYWEQFNEKTGRYELWCRGVYKRNPNGSTKGYINSLTLSSEEALVHLAAHEFRHLWQKNHSGKRGKVWGARGKYSDRDADAYAIRKKREWRRTNYRKTDALGLSYFLWRQYGK